MKVTFWGVRGSIPSPLTTREIEAKIVTALKGAKPSDLQDDKSIRSYVESLPLSVRGTVGGNTSCVEVSDGSTEIIIDAGSGLRRLGEKLLLGDFGKGKGVGHILLSHFHWDHIQGIPFFVPAYIPGNRLFFYSPRRHFQKLLEKQQNFDNFPKGFNDLPADIECVELKTSGSIKIENMDLSWIKLNHPGDSYAYRLENSSGSLVYATDCEYEILCQEDIDKYVSFFSGCDILIFDSMFTPRAAEEHPGWGHSTAQMGVEIARKADIKRLILYHHEPSYDDAKLERICQSAEMKDCNNPKNKLQVIVAYEGLTLEL
jgi:phosphoribosyl 1,2-cyclic phosphodiesterase